MSWMDRFIWQLYAITVLYRWFRQMSGPLERNGCVQNFKWISEKVRDHFMYLQHNWETDMAI